MSNRKEREMANENEMPPQRIRKCGANDGDGRCEEEGFERFSLGITAGYWCDPHWKTSGYRKEPASAFDPADCGETYEPDDWGGDEW